jgi:hypothetical protein
MRISKLILVLGLTAFYLLFTLTIVNDTFLDYDQASTFAAQLRRKALEGSGYGGDNRYSKENVSKIFVPSDPTPTLNFDPASTFAAQLMRKKVEAGYEDSRYSTDRVTRVFSPSSYVTPQFNPQPDYIYAKDNLLQLYSAIVIGPVIIVLSYILLDKLIRE